MDSSQDASDTQQLLVVLFNLGGPAGPANVRPFLRRLFRDPEIIRLPWSDVLQAPLAELIVALRAGKVKRAYKAIGGGSPLLGWTEKQSRKLEALLRQRGRDVDVVVAMRYAEPTADDVLRPLVNHGYDRLIWLPLYPQRSDCTTGAAARHLREVLEDLEWRIPVSIVEGFRPRAGFYEAWAGRLEEELRHSDGPAPTVVFSAHSVPMRLIDAGDPYRDDIEECVRRIVELLPAGVPVRLGYQSRSGPVRWLGPDVTTVLKMLSEEDVKSVIVCPLSFVSDHLETLHEIDIEMAEKAQGFGITSFKRCASLNDGDDFIGALVDTVESTLTAPARTAPMA